MSKFFSKALLATLALALSACGGDDAFETPGPGGGGTVDVASVALSTGSPTIPADGSVAATLSARVRDANNNAVPDVAVTFAATDGNLVVSQGTTDATGLATATLDASGAAVGTTITVTASVGTVSSTVDVEVVDTQQTITVITSLPQIPSNSSSAATITALVRGANNQFLADVPVSFEATSGGLTVVNAVTDENGSATATLSAAGDPTNRLITVTANAGSASATVPVEVTGTTLTVTGPPNLVLGSDGTYTVSLTDSGNAGIPNQVIELSSDNGNALSDTSVTTNATGQRTFTLTASASGTDLVSAAALGMEAQQQISVSNQDFSFTAPDANDQIDLGDDVTLTVHWESSGNPVVGEVVTFSATRGVLDPIDGEATTDASGNASVSISSTTSGPAIISASGTGVTTQLAVNFIATDPDTIAIQTSPSTIPTQGQSTITAIVRDADNNLVEGQTVDFLLADITGGGLSVASALTDSQGRAQTVYTASSTPSSSNGVTVSATVRGAGIPAATTTITVGGQTVFLALGTGNKILENDSQTQFRVPYLVQALDSAGNPVDGVTVTLTVHSLPVDDGDDAYGKGAWNWNGTLWQQTGTPGIGFAPITTCPNEDSNLNGVLDAGEDDSGLGNDNDQLDPGDVAVVIPGTLVTADGGEGNVTVRYPQDHAAWVRVKLTATATVQGTETSTSSIFWLPQLASYLTSESVVPPGQTSPFGVATTCTDPD